MPDWNEENSSLKKNIFLTIPKTASRTVGQYMEKYSEILHHDHWKTQYDISIQSDLKNMPEFKDYFIYTFGRNPYKKIISCYECLYAEPLEVKEWGKEEITREHFTFERFVNIITQEINPAYQRKPCWNIHWEPQTSFILNKDDKLQVDYVGNVETIIDDIDYICNEIGLNLTRTGPCCHKLSPDGKRPKWKVRSIGTSVGKTSWLHSDYKSYYTDDIKKKVAKYYERDIEFFKTTF